MIRMIYLVLSVTLDDLRGRNCDRASFDDESPGNGGEELGNHEAAGP